MIHGLLWLPLLAVFIGLAWAGWNEYQKVQTYQAWAKGFERSKYDLYAVLGQNQETLTWGKPTRAGIVDLQTFSLHDVATLQLLSEDRAVDPQITDGSDRHVAIKFHLHNTTIHRIPFTQFSLASQWFTHLQQDWQRYKGSVAISD
jgi:hypothetical protein